MEGEGSGERPGNSQLSPLTGRDSGKGEDVARSLWGAINCFPENLLRRALTIHPQMRWGAGVNFQSLVPPGLNQELEI